jgi:predicted solute-binding protein
LKYIWRLHEEGKSNTYIRDKMNKRYGTTLRTSKPYYTTQIYEMIKKYRRRLERMKDYEEEYLKVEFIRVENWKKKSTMNIR